MPKMEVVEPPIQELSSKLRTLGCLVAFGVDILFVVGVIEPKKSGEVGSYGIHG